MALNTLNQMSELPALILDVYSDEFLFAAQGSHVFENFAVQRMDLMKNPGDTLTFIKYGDFSGSPELSAGAEATAQDTVGESMTTSTVSITVKEHLKSTQVTEKLLITSFTDVMHDAVKVLARHYADWGVDRSLKHVALLGDGTQTPSVVYANGRAGRTSLVAGDTFDTNLVRDCVETLQTRNAPKFNNDFYVCVLHPHQARYLKQDPDWVSTNNYANTRALFKGEIGRWEDVIFIESTNLYNGVPSASTSVAFLDVNADTNNDLKSGVAGNQTDVYMASIFGDSYLALAWALPTELRDDGVTNFGRFHKIAYYGIWGAGLLLGEHGLRIETA